jgi:hypothetical protein
MRRDRILKSEKDVAIARPAERVFATRYFLVGRRERWRGWQLDRAMTATDPSSFARIVVASDEVIGAKHFPKIARMF